MSQEIEEAFYSYWQHLPYRIPLNEAMYEYTRSCCIKALRHFNQVPVDAPIRERVRFVEPNGVNELVEQAVALDTATILARCEELGMGKGAMTLYERWGFNAVERVLVTIAWWMTQTGYRWDENERAT